MFPWQWLALVALIPMTLSANAGVKVKLTEKGLEYGKQMGVASLQQKLKTIKVPDISGTQKVSPIGKVKYTLSNIQMVNIELPKSMVVFVPGTGVKLSIGNAFLSLRGNWRIKYLRFIKDSGSFDLGINDLTIATSISVRSDETGRPTVGSAGCLATLGRMQIKFHGGASWLYNLFSKFIEKALRSSLQNQICPLVADAVSAMNPYLKTLNVLAPVDKYAEIEYSMVSSPQISNAIDLSLKGEFYNIGKHVEPPFIPAPFFLPTKVDSMLYIGVSAFTANSAGFVYNKAGVLSLNISDDMIPRSSPIRLNTRTFGVFIPEIARRFPGLKMKLLVKAVKDPFTAFEPDHLTLQVNATVTAYAIQANSTLSPLFVLNTGASVSTKVYMTGTKLAGALALNKMDMTLGRSYVGDFQVRLLNTIFQTVLKVAMLPYINAQLGKGFPLPTIGKMSLRNTQLQVQKGYLLIGTDVQFAR